jgi:hypothetical protein
MKKKAIYSASFILYFFIFGILLLTSRFIYWQAKIHRARYKKREALRAWNRRCAMTHEPKKDIAAVC